MGFHSFILLAEMRTGSNYLESNLNAIEGLHCHGEAFNPTFIGYPKRDDLMGISLETRESDPKRVLKAMRAAPGLNGFRYFHDHDPRILTPCLDDPGCAKIILTRNPIDSYISLKIARETGQWKLTNPNRARSKAVEFDQAEFEQHLGTMQSFQIQVLNHLQRSGQTAFYIAYDDLRDLDVINGLATWLGVPGRLDKLDQTLKPQNPGAAQSNVVNVDEMSEALARLDRFDLTRTPNFEPRRGPVAPSYVGSSAVPLLFQPVRGGPEGAVRRWLSDFGGDLVEGFTRSSLKRWQRAMRPHRSFTVLRHPLARAHAAFCEKILPTEGDSYLAIREALRRHHKVPLKARADAPGYDHRAAFEGFLTFLERNLQGQTGLRVDPWWTSQSTVLEGFSRLNTPDLVIREERLPEGLAFLALELGLEDMPDPPQITDPHLPRLLDIYDGKLEKRARQIYQRDFQVFGFERLK